MASWMERERENKKYCHERDRREAEAPALGSLLASRSRQKCIMSTCDQSKMAARPFVSPHVDFPEALA